MRKGIFQRKTSFKETLNIGFTDSRKKLSFKEQSSFYKRLHILYKSGVSFIRALELIEIKSKNKSLKRDLNSIIFDIKNGITISRAFISKGKCFDDFGLKLIAIGEETGKLEEILDNLSNFYLDKHRSNKKIKENMAYPRFLIIITIMVVNLIMLNILPSFYMLVETSEEVPKFTIIMVDLAMFLSNSKKIVISMQLFIFISMSIFLKSNIFIKNKYKIFPFSVIEKKIYVFNLHHSFALTTCAGISIVEALNIVGDIFMHIDVNRLKEKFNENYSLSQSFRELGYGNDTTFELLEVGEEGGSLEEMLKSCYLLLKEEFDSQLKKYVDMLSPIAIMFLGMIILIVALAMISPVLDIMSMI